MRRKDFELIAKVVKRLDMGKQVQIGVTENFCCALGAETGNFDADKFRQDCGL